MKLYFESSDDNLTFLGDCETIVDCISKLNEFLDSHNYISYYTRLFNITHKDLGEVTCLDVGSHSEFFYIVPSINIYNVGGK